MASASPPPGGTRELLALAWPLVLSNSFMTFQMTVDRVLLSRYQADAVGAAIAAVLFYWTPLTLLQQTAAYATAFVAQYTGAGRPQRVGPAVWQALHFGLVSGLAFLGLSWLAEPLARLGNHAPEMQALEAEYFRILCYAALPNVLMAAACAFFAGRGDSRTVLLVNAAGSVVNAALAFWWIFGGFGIPALGITGAGWAYVAASWVSAVVALGLMLRPRYREEYATLTGWRPEPELMGRLMWYGLPTGLQWALEGLAFTVFVLLIGRMGAAEQSATSIAVTINMVAFLPMMGVGQAVEILVGQRLGQDRPDLAERTTYAGYYVACAYMAVCALLFVLTPVMFVAPFENSHEPEKWAPVAAMVPVILRFVAVYSLFDSINAVFSFALRGAGDTRFVTAVSLSLAWPLMVLPTWWALETGRGLYWPWGFASAYIIAMAGVFVLRFRHGKWKSMRVIETVPPEAEGEPQLAGTGEGGA
jgi:MATE family multidrug resistance protein